MDESLQQFQDRVPTMGAFELLFELEDRNAEMATSGNTSYAKIERIRLLRREIVGRMAVADKVR